MKHNFKKFLSLLLALSFVMGLAVAPSVSVEAKAKAKKNIVVVLDPGHDSTHTGCTTSGLNEENINLYIAYYCKNELEKYDGVTVYMTRYDWTCPYGADESQKSSCLSARVKYAKSVKADVYVSLHNDYNPSDATANGCKVIIPNPSYKPALCTQSQALATSIISQLTATGLNINVWEYCPTTTGIVTRDSSSKYPDGSAKDYYAVINQSKTAGIPGIIIEHAYLSNKSDRTNHLSTVEQYQQLGVADATGIANYYGLTLKK